MSKIKMSACAAGRVVEISCENRKRRNETGKILSVP